MAHLKITTPHGEREQEVQGPLVLIGRGPTTTVSIQDPQASKEHCQLERVGNRWKLVDLESKNGTKVNGRFRNKAWLQRGDKISLGQTVVEFGGAGVGGARTPHDLAGEGGGARLVHAGAGGLGQLVVQLAKARGAVVYTTVGSAEKAEIAKARGADHVILYREVDFAVAVSDLTGGEGVNVVYDSVGRDTIQGSLKCLKPRGVLSNNGNASGPIGAFDPLDLAEAGSVFFTRPHLADYIPTAEERNRRADDLFRLYREDKITVTIDRVFPLVDAKAAHDAIEGRQTKGKLLLEAEEDQGSLPETGP